MKVFKGDISDAEAEIIVNAANRIGFMGGWIGRIYKTKGVAESIHYHRRSIWEI